MKKYFEMHIWIVFCLILSKVCQSKAAYIKMKPHVTSRKLFDDEIKDFVFNITLQVDQNEQQHGPVGLKVISTNSDIASVANELFIIPENTISNISVRIFGQFLGEMYIKFLVNQSMNGTINKPIMEGDSKWYEYSEVYNVIVTRDSRPIDTVFTVSVIILVCTANIAMGCKTDLDVVITTLKKPIAPLIGLSSQFILMPLISFTLCMIFNLQPALAFGLFAMGCSPGGAASNIYTHLLDGDVSLSVTMTFVSTIASLGFIPMWLYSLGINYIYKDADTVTIPYENIITSLLGLLIPVGIGILIQKKKPEWARRFIKCVPYLTAIFLIFVFTVGVYANLYIFKLLTPIVLISGALAPYLGFAFGALVGFIFRQTPKHILTIAIETGIQNTGIAIVLLKVSLPAPDSDISIAPPITSSIFTPIPMVIAMLIHYIRKRMLKKRCQEDDVLDDTYPDNVTRNVVAMKYEEVLNKSDTSDEEPHKI